MTEAAEELPVSCLRHRWDPDRFDFATTAELPPLAGVIGQDRALAALLTAEGRTWYQDCGLHHAGRA